jgi:hypothetical protein
MKFNQVEDIVILEEKIEGLIPTMRYRDTYFVPLKDFLALPDSALML